MVDGKITNNIVLIGSQKIDFSGFLKDRTIINKETRFKKNQVLEAH
jgi:hypothetical protein